ncbi:caspase family protein [Geobacter hydrogenophilus]|uniref:Peptidase C14 caspase domain-containing protein n=1 Tax=Geobacter hydrogenophilus TaxID=40983 RepID=A0A9W6FXJ1_9BACT|nr:caspase family protein [Geobacter hydrogenophilus]MBT0895051.1 caspase family protein [Geobacter hydrogenophilus]GLI36875.1 hypothetical protein GHYDROH2_03760 [Geobacter hydrogenophilus]
MLIRLAVMVLLFICSATAALAVRQKVKMSVQPHVDTTLPSIVIISPIVNRGPVTLAKGAKLAVKGIATDESGVASVTVNGKEVTIDDQGAFAADVMLNPGQSQIVVAAFDANGNKSQQVITLNRSGSVPLADNVNGSGQGKNYALLIGINGYKNIQPLTSAINDVNTVTQVLRDDYGFVTTVLIDAMATRSGIARELARIRKELNPEDRLLIYYAGHGFHDKETDTSYWLPVDADQNEVTEWLPTRDVTDELHRCKARQVLIVSDSCYAGTISRSFNPNLAGEGSRNNYLQKMMGKPSRVLIASGGNEPVADGATGHSPFADAFVKALTSPFDTQFTAEELLTRQIKESVAGHSAQTPQYKVIHNSGHDGGDFVFVKLR